MRAAYESKIESITQERLIYLDESGVNEYLYRELAGSKVYGEISGKRFARESVISALKEGKLFSPMCFSGTCDTEVFNIWLKQELLPNLGPGYVLVLVFIKRNQQEK